MRAEAILCTNTSSNVSTCTQRHIVETVDGAIYDFFIDSFTDLFYAKSVDRGKSWQTPVLVKAGSVDRVAVWYDRWSGIAAGRIHIAYVDNAVDDILFRSLDTENADSLGTEVTVFAGATAVAGGNLAITKARGGNIVIAGSIDAGAEDGAWESNDNGATWSGTIADPSEGATNDQYILLPGWNADTQDVMLVFWDASADELSIKRYDDSANTWAETSIATGMVETFPSTVAPGPHFAVAVDLENSRNLLVAWSAIDALNADLRCWKIDDTTITEVTNVVQNSTDDQGMCAIAIDTRNQEWWVAYGGKTDGSETYSSALNIYAKVSKDAGSTWSSEFKLWVQVPASEDVRSIGCAPRTNGPMMLDWLRALNSVTYLHASIENGTPRAGLHIGI